MADISPPADTLEVAATFVATALRYYRANALPHVDLEQNKVAHAVIFRFRSTPNQITLYYDRQKYDITVTQTPASDD
jgi:hypothetical protein